MKRRAIICFIILFTLSFGLNFEIKAQSLDSLSLLKDDYNKGKNFYKKGLYNYAFPYFVALARQYPKNANFNYCAGMCYYHISAVYDSAIYYLSKATKPTTSFYKMNYQKNNAPNEAYYYLGMSYMRNSMPETAINHFNAYKKYLDPEIKAQRELIEDIDLQIALCEKEKEYFRQVREARNAGRDSIQKVANHFKEQYLNILSVLEQRDQEIERLHQETANTNTSQIKPIAQLKNSNGEPFLYTIQIVATRNKIDMREFKDIVGIQECYLPDGLYHYVKGEFKTRGEAEDFCRELWDLGYVNAWVCPILKCL
ncbi:MAG: hypothetical protein LBH92_01965 [Bacteroidales bacterium]|jgi:hypothetical protein|nr:hypothetical protein [Bacteroidales bacterium]